MALYRYVQQEEKSTWLPIPVDSNFDKTVKDMGVVRLSVLAISEILKDDDKEVVPAYMGPFYADIDVAGDLKAAIASVQQLVAKLMELDIPEGFIEVYCSGSKGFHLFVPETAFLTTARPIKSLPYIYREMALDLYVQGLDFAVYSGGKGHMFRPPDGLRPDGHYRVRITHEELWQITPEDYAVLVSAPRNLQFPTPEPHKSVLMLALFERARKRANARAATRGVPLPVEQLEPYAEEPPGCIETLVAGEFKASVKFNQAGLQLAAFAARAGAPDYKVESLISLMAENTSSSSYDTPAKRRVHLKGLLGYARVKTSVTFSCNAIRSVVGIRKCKDCPLGGQSLDARQDVEEDGAVLGMLVQPEGYFLKQGKGEVRVSTFTLLPTEVHMDEGQNEGTARRTTTRMDVLSHHAKIGSVSFDEAGWRGKSQFLQQLEGINGIAFLGGDADIQRIKHAVYNQTEDGDLDEVVNTYVVGMHVSRLGKKKIYTYVEPGLSVNTYGVHGTHRLQGTVTQAPTVRKAMRLDAGAPLEVGEALESLLQINRPDVVARLLGWFCAAHLRAHIHPIFKQFPVLSVWGAAGSGKSHTCAMFALLNGVDYFEGSPLSVSTSTAWPIIEVCSSTTTVPRLLEEFNQAKMRAPMYALVVDILKAAWDGISVSRGTLRKSAADGQGKTGATVYESVISAPIAVCSEQCPQVPAVVQRSVQVQLTQAYREGRVEPFRRARARKDFLMGVGRAMTMVALKTSEQQVQDWYYANEEMLPSWIFDRYRFSTAVLMTGLDFFGKVAGGLKLGVADKVPEMKRLLVEAWEAEGDTLLTSHARSEVDAFLESFAEMAQLAAQNHPTALIVIGKNFAVNSAQDELIFDLSSVYSMYRRHMRQAGDPVIFATLAQLEPLIKSEPYFVSNSRMEPRMVLGRPVWVLKLSAMQGKGIDVSMFSG